MKAFIKRQLTTLNQLVELNEPHQTGPPSTLYIGVTNICNAKCTFCNYRKSTDKKGIMPFDLFKKAIDQYIEMNGKNISFTPTVGDPLIDPNLLEKIHYASNQKGINRIYFYTNGILLNQNKNYQKLVDSGIKKINISCPQFDGVAYQRIYGVNAYDSFIQGIDNLIQYNESVKKIEIELNFRQDCTEKEAVEMADFQRVVVPYLSDRLKYSFLKDYDNWGGSIQQWELTGTMKLRKPPVVKLLPCVRMYDLMVLWNGDFRICACRFKVTENDDLVIGNIFQNSLKEAFESKRVRELRDSFRNNQLTETCKACTLYVPSTKYELGSHQHRVEK